jgi:hypothetical protein
MGRKTKKRSSAQFNELRDKLNNLIKSIEVKKNTLSRDLSKSSKNLPSSSILNRLNALNIAIEEATQAQNELLEDEAYNDFAQTKPGDEEITKLCVALRDARTFAKSGGVLDKVAECFDYDLRLLTEKCFQDKDNPSIREQTEELNSLLDKQIFDKSDIAKIERLRGNLAKQISSENKFKKRFAGLTISPWTANTIVKDKDALDSLIVQVRWTEEVLAKAERVSQHGTITVEASPVEGQPLNSESSHRDKGGRSSNSSQDKAGRSSISQTSVSTKPKKAVAQTPVKSKYKKPRSLEDSWFFSTPVLFTILLCISLLLFSNFFFIANPFDVIALVGGGMMTGKVIDFIN